MPIQACLYSVLYQRRDSGFVETGLKKQRMANKAGLKPRRVNRSVMGAPLSLQKRPPQPDQDVLEWLADLHVFQTDSGPLSSARRLSQKGNNFARDPRSSPSGNLAKFRSSEKGKFSPEIPGEIHQSSRRNLTFAVKFAAGCGEIGSSP